MATTVNNKRTFAKDIATKGKRFSGRDYCQKLFLQKGYYKCFK